MTSLNKDGRIIELLTEMVRGQDKLANEVFLMKLEVKKLRLQAAKNSRAILKFTEILKFIA